MLARIQHYARRLNESYHERRLNIVTEEYHQQIDPERPDFRGYSTHYRDWRHIQPHIAADRGASFIDYGAGLGRVAVLAAQLPYRRVIGIELDQSLTDRGRANIRRARGLMCPAEILCRDATTFEVPTDAAALFFCNPFTGAVLAAVLENARRSIRAVSRPVQIICNLPPSSAFEDQIRALEWLSLGRQIPLTEGRKCLIFQPKL